MWKQNLRQLGGQPENLPSTTHSSSELWQIARHSGGGVSWHTYRRQVESELRPISFKPAPTKIAADKGKPRAYKPEKHAAAASIEELEREWTLGWPHRPQENAPAQEPTDSILAMFEPDLAPDDIFDAVDRQESTTDQLHFHQSGSEPKPCAALAGPSPWSANEEQALVAYVQSHFAPDKISWDAVAAEFGRAAVGCMAKYYALVDRDVRNM